MGWIEQQGNYTTLHFILHKVFLQ